MRKLKLVVIALLGLTSLASAQEYRFNAYSAYVFDDRVDSYYSSTDYFGGTIEGGYQWGGGLELKLDQRKSIELKYLRMDTYAPITYYDYDAIVNTSKFKNFDLAVNYVLLDFKSYAVLPNEKIEPYFGGGFGMGIFSIGNPEPGMDNSKVKFAWNILAGTNIMLSPKVGFKLQAELISAVQSVGGGFYFGTGGASAGVSTYSSMLQFGLGGGLSFALGSEK